VFELSILRKYLVPRKKQLSVTLIAFLSVGVISAVVWLVLLFLSVTEGIEKTWLKKLTSIHAPIRITPTEHYFSSYYYLADTISQETGYTPRSLSEKLKRPGVDLYDPTVDETPPGYWPLPEKEADGTLRDPVMIASNIIKKIPDAQTAPFEMSGAVLRLQLNRQTPRGVETQSFLTQASYLSSYPEGSTYVSDLIIPPTPADLQQMLFQSVKNGTIKSYLTQLKIDRVKTTGSAWHVPIEMLPDGEAVPAKALVSNGRVLSVAIGESNHPEKGTLKREGTQLFWNRQPVHAPVVLTKPCEWKAKISQNSLSRASKISDIRLDLEGTVGGIKLAGPASFNDLEISKGSYQSKISPTPEERGIILAKGFYDTGVRLGDRGWIQYHASTAGSLQEQRLAVVVTGFYDPGVMSVGNKCILAPDDLVHMIRTSSPIEHFDKKASMGFCVWHDDLTKTKQLASEIQNEFNKAGISKYWTITTFHDYEFSKDLMQQFQSDRYLFSFLGIIVLIVACSNIISFLILLVQDKKREIGILQALGASKKSIAIIFGGCGAVIGLVSSFIGIGAAYLTLKNLDSIVKFLSFLQGHAAFNAAFYGSSLPSEMSVSALVFVAIITPILSLVAGLIPARKACKFSPSEILRSE
jgi:lipoprotein-releasing system permease protein